VSPVLSPPSISATSQAAESESTPEFQLTVSKTPTPHALYLPETSPRYKALSKIPNAIIEISPESLTCVSDMAIRIGGASRPTKKTEAASYMDKPVPSGAALILDYGPTDTIPANTLRGIRQHKLVSPFAAPGEVDLSADVDFMALAEAALNASPGVEIHGPVEQAAFLGAMGIQERVKMLVNKARDQKEQKTEDVDDVVRRIESGWKRLVDRGPTGMGRIYKAMAIVPYDSKKKTPRRPVGFGGDVQV